MECKAAPPTSPPPPTAATAALISSVLGDDDLLREILLRLGFPTCLVRAALVSKRWLRHASDPAFLRRFRDLHPPRPLGSYVIPLASHLPRFVPVPHPPELAAVVHRGSFDVDPLTCGYIQSLRCSNGRILAPCLGTNIIHAARFPLFPARGTAILPPTPQIHGGVEYYYDDVFSDDGFGPPSPSIFFLGLKSDQERSVADLYELQDGASCWVLRASAAIDIFEFEPDSVLLVGTKIYMVSTMGDTLVFALLDLVSSSFSVSELPQGVDRFWGFQLSPAGDSRVYLTNVKGLQLRVWIRRENGNWLLVNTICLREIGGNQMMPIWALADEDNSDVIVHAVGGLNAEFVLLVIGNVLYLLDTRRRVVDKLYEVTPADVFLIRAYLFLMVWPPIFPVIKEEIDEKE